MNAQLTDFIQAGVPNNLLRNIGCRVQVRLKVPGLTDLLPSEPGRIVGFAKVEGVWKHLVQLRYTRNEIDLPPHPTIVGSDEIAYMHYHSQSDFAFLRQAYSEDDVAKIRGL